MGGGLATPPAPRYREPPSVIPAKRDRGQFDNSRGTISCDPPWQNCQTVPDLAVVPDLVCSYLAGKRAGFVVHEPVDVRAVRTRTKLTRARFAERFGLDMRTVEQWERGRRKPDRSTETYLRLIDKAPDTVAELVARL